MAKPRLLLFDEPSAGVPPTVARELFAALRELHERGTAIVVAEQRAGAGARRRPAARSSSAPGA